MSENIAHLFLDFMGLHLFGCHYQNTTAHSTQESGGGHCNFTPEKDYSEILITWQKEMRLQPVLVGFFQIWIDRAVVGG